MTHVSYERIGCPLCSGPEHRSIGIRGNREYQGADPLAQPHLFTEVVRCRRCDFIFTNPMIRGMEHLETNYYGDPVRYHATADGDTEGMFRARLLLLEEFRGDSRLLDIGAGKGEFVAMANGAGWKAAGLEPSEGFRRFARGRLNIDLIPDSIDKIQPSYLGTFDVATLNHVLEHVDNPVPFLRHAARALRPGGVLFVEVPNCDSNLLRFADLYHRIRGRNWSTRLSPLHPPFHRYGFTSRSLRFALESAGFSISRILTMSGRDRGYRGKASAATALRTLAASILDRFGNLELLAAIARIPG